ncbi:PTS glucitol/sorbitol transporter subunit IIA [Ligilactobacillus faecis]|uniref:PTS glucitol/sorbitol transporter subunit IIA n=1 Tax=Ligilactobacillus faecis TaxID=762833 RepID=A0ABV4DNQ1_9LACO
MIKSEVMAIGPEAISDKEPMLILFDESASERLREVSVIQRFENDATKNYDLQVGSKIQIDAKEYTVKYLGELVESNLTSIGHTVFNFKELPSKEHLQENVIYLEPHVLPQIKVGSQIIYGH